MLSFELTPLCLRNLKSSSRWPSAGLVAWPLSCRSNSIHNSTAIRLLSNTSRQKRNPRYPYNANGLSPQIHRPYQRPLAPLYPPNQAHFQVFLRLKSNKEPTPIGKEPTSMYDAPSPIYPIKFHPFNRFKIFRVLPKSLKKLVINFYHQPISSLVAFVLVYEISGLVPFAGTWYLLQNYEDASYIASLISSGAFAFPDWILIKGTGVIDSILQNTNLVETFSVRDTTRLIVNGAKAFAVTQVLFPVRAFLSLFLMSPVNRLVVRPVINLFDKKKNKKIMKIEKVNRDGKNEPEIWNASLEHQPEFKKLKKRRL